MVHGKGCEVLRISMPLDEDEIRSVGGAGSTKGVPPSATSPCFLSRFSPYEVRKW